MIRRSRFARGAAMNPRTIGLMLAGALGFAAALVVATASSALAQSTLGGAKAQQNKIGGVAKPAPVVGGAAIHTPPPPALPKPVVGTVKPAGTVTPGTASSAPLNPPPGPRPNPSVTPPKPAGPVVTSNLKCANGVCTSRGPKP
jgi:hypothetical protein